MIICKSKIVSYTDLLVFITFFWISNFPDLDFSMKEYHIEFLYVFLFVMVIYAINKYFSLRSIYLNSDKIIFKYFSSKEFEIKLIDLVEFIFVPSTGRASSVVIFKYNHNNKIVKKRISTIFLNKKCVEKINKQIGLYLQLQTSLGVK